MAETKDQQQTVVCPVCKHAYEQQIPDFCTDCSWEFIFTNEKTPEFERYIQEKQKMHKDLYDRMNTTESRTKELEEKLAAMKELLKKKNQEATQLKKGAADRAGDLDTLKGENTQLTERLEHTLADLEQAKAKLLDQAIRRTTDPGREKTKVYISYKVEGRKWISIRFDKPGYGIPDIMWFYFAKEDPKRRVLLISNSDICLYIKSSNLIEENGFYKYFFPSFMEGLEGSMEGSLYLPIVGKFEIDPKIGTIKF